MESVLKSVIDAGILNTNLSNILINCMFIAIETIGVTQFLKNFLKTKNNNTKIYCIVSLIWCALSAFIIIFVSGIWALVFNVCFLSLALTQICYETIVQALPRFLTGIINGAVGKVGITERIPMPTASVPSQEVTELDGK